MLCLTLDGMVSYPRMPRWARVGTTEMPEYRWGNHSSEVMELVLGRCGGGASSSSLSLRGPPCSLRSHDEGFLSLLQVNFAPLFLPH